MVLPSEGLGTVSALEGRLASMLPHMVHEMLPAGKRLGAIVAAVRGFPGVLAHVV